MSNQNLTRRSVLSGLFAAPVLAACSSGDSKNAASSSAVAPSSRSVSIPSVSHDVDLTPVRLEIPMLNLDKPIVSAGLSAKGEIDPKQGTVQWYNATVEPGREGHSVIAGHVTYNGKDDVFVKLDTMVKGAHISVFAKDGSSKTFVVTRTASIDKDALETNQDVWGSTKETSLVLITCDSRSKLQGVHHVNNFVVWASPSAV